MPINLAHSSYFVDCELVLDACLDKCKFRPFHKNRMLERLGRPGPICKWISIVELSLCCTRIHQSARALLSGRPVFGCPDCAAHCSGAHAETQSLSCGEDLCLNFDASYLGSGGPTFPVIELEKAPTFQLLFTCKILSLGRSNVSRN